MLNDQATFFILPSDIHINVGDKQMEPGKLNRNTLLLIVVACIVIGALVLVYGNGINKEPVRVGFSATLTGSQAELGVQERNGVQLAMEDINAAGGVNGRPIELIVRDDLGTPDGAKSVDSELINSSVVAIIGPATSDQALAALDVTNPARMVMISPTVSSPLFSGKDDYFFMAMASNPVRAQAFAQAIYLHRNVTRIAAIYDTDNAAYTQTYLESFAEKYESLGGMVVAQDNFSSITQPDFTPLLLQLRAGNPDGLLIIASDADTALIAQRARSMGWQVPLFTSTWAETETLITNGGKAVGGMEIEQVFPLDSQAPDYREFKTRFETRFGQSPSFGAMYGFESMKVLAAALQKTNGRADGLKQALLGIQNFTGLVNSFSFNQYGDVVRPFSIGSVRNGTFVTTDVYPPAGS
jgi:branched-chain amino acid transport system substrate-binding protein